MNENNSNRISAGARPPLTEVARMYYERNLSQQQIAEALGVSRSLIALYLKQARDAGIVRIEIREPEETREDLALALQQRAGLRRVVVTPSAGRTPALARRAIAGALARHLEDTLPDGARLGIGFGRTIAEMAELLAPSRPRRIDVLPLVGESSSGLIGTYSQVNQHVLKIARSFNASPRFLLAPLVVGSPALRDLLRGDAAAQPVVTAWQQLTHACVGIGTLPPVTGEIIYIGEEHLADFQAAGSVGDVCSRYFDSQGRFIDHPIYQRIIGIEPEQLRQVEHLIAVVNGVEKAAATSGLLRSGIVDALFLDEDLARAVVQELA